MCFITILVQSIVAKFMPKRILIKSFVTDAELVTEWIVVDQLNFVSMFQVRKSWEQRISKSNVLKLIGI